MCEFSHTVPILFYDYDKMLLDDSYPLAGRSGQWFKIVIRS